MYLEYVVKFGYSMVLAKIYEVSGSFDPKNIWGITIYGRN